MKKKVLVTYNMFRSGYAELVEKYDVTFPPDGAESFTYEEVLRMIPEYDALQSMFNFPVDKQLMDAGVKLKIISNYAVGYDNDFILVKAYRALRDSIGISLPRYDKNTTEYYIIPVNNTQEAWEAQENKLGAFSKKDFEVKRKELGKPIFFGEGEITSALGRGMPRPYNTCDR